MNSILTQASRAAVLIAAALSLAACAAPADVTAEAALTARPTLAGQHTQASAQAQPTASPTGPAMSQAPTQAAAPTTSAPSVPVGAGRLATATAPASVWLAGSQLPGPSDWRVAGAPLTQSLNQDMDVPLCPGLTGETSWLIQSFTSASDSGAAAEEEILRFATPDAATQAYRQALVHLSGCQAESQRLQTANRAPTDAVITENADAGPLASAWTRAWTGVASPISVAGAQTDLQCLAVSGDVLGVVTVRLPGAGPNASAAGSMKALLATIATDLSGYGSDSGS